MVYEVIGFEQSGHVVTVTLNRPEALNALSRELQAEMADALGRVRDDDSVRVLVLTGTGRAFSAGADLKQRVQNDSAGGDSPDAIINPRRGLSVTDIGKPSIAAINGYALGGGLELAMTCDLRIASTAATLGLPEITRGFFPGGGGPQRLPRLIPRAMAMEMLLTGDPIDAETAQQWGLVSRVVEPEELMPRALAIAERIAEHAPLAVQANRELAYATDDMTLQQSLRFGNSLRWVIGQTDDAKEGPRAFSEKRAPEYRGR